MDAYSQIDERPALHRDGAVRRVGRRDRARRAGPHRAAEPRGEPSCSASTCWRAIGRPLGRRGAGIRRPAARGARARRSARAPPRSQSARRRGGARCWCASAPSCTAAGAADGLRRDLRRHHRAAVGAAQGRLGRRRAAHRARDQESADPDPARRRAAEAALRQRDHLRPGDLRAVRRHHRPPCRRYRPHGGRVLRLRAHAAAGDPAARMSARSCARRWCCSAPRGRRSRGTTDIPERGPVVPLRPAAARPGADQPAAERRRRGRDARRARRRRRDRGGGRARRPTRSRITVTDDGVGLPQQIAAG